MGFLAIQCLLIYFHDEVIFISCSQSNIFVICPFYWYFVERLSEDKSRSLVGAILSKVVPATFSTIASFSRMIWRSEQTSPGKSDVKPQSFARGK